MTATTDTTTVRISPMRDRKRFAKIVSRLKTTGGGTYEPQTKTWTVRSIYLQPGGGLSDLARGGEIEIVEV